MTELTWFWIGLGIVLCVLELVIPTALAELVMGLGAIVTGFASLVIPSFAVQIFLWMVLSLVGLVGVRRFLPRRTPRILESSVEAQTLTEIMPGEKGRVLYEGSPWQGRCEEATIAIAAQTKVFVVGREGTTLIVMPQDYGTEADWSEEI
jgi:membrane protein implicated in regulation of membrane protease activity